MLTERQCGLIEAGLTEAVEPRKVAAYLCLHMGLMLAEAAGLRRDDIDLVSGSVVLRDLAERGDLSKDQQSVGESLSGARVLPMPPQVRHYLEMHESLYADGSCFIMSGDKTPPALYLMQNILTSVKLKYKISGTLSATDLRDAFIRRCIQSGMDLYSLCAYIGIKQPNVIVRRFGEYFEPRLEEVKAIEKFVNAAAEPLFDPNAPKRMNLLILGAGSQGAVVKEIAEAIGIFDEIAFLDDDTANKLAIGPLKDLEKLRYRFPLGTASFGDSKLREQYMNELEKNGYVVPSLIHPSVTLSSMATVDRSAVIEARSIVSAGAKIGRGALLSGASVIEANASIGQFAHIGSSVTVAKGAAVEAYTRVPSGTVIRINKDTQQDVRKAD